MTPLRKGLVKPVRGASGEHKANNTVVNPIDDQLQRLDAPQLSNDGGRPLKRKRRARRKHKTRSACINNQDNQQTQYNDGNDDLCKHSPFIKDNHQGFIAKEIKNTQNNRVHKNKLHSKTFVTSANLKKDTQDLASLHIDNYNSVNNLSNEQRTQDIHGCAKRQASIIKNEIKRDTKQENKKKINPSFYKKYYRKFYLKRHHINNIELNGAEKIVKSEKAIKVETTIKLDCMDNLTAKSDSHSVFKNINNVKSAHHNKLYAALDLGTNNCRLLIASPTRPGFFRVVDGFSRIVRLGEGLSRLEYLNEAAMDRAIEALKVCAEKLSQYNISYQRLIATEACRSAKNGCEFIERVLNETGIQLEIVNRETEARLAVSGCGTLVEPETEAIVLFDIGGGSSEIALIDISNRRSPRLADHIIAWTSLPVGVVTLAERFGGELVTKHDFIAMKNYVTDLLTHFHDREKLGTLVKHKSFHLIGTSGTVTTLAGIHLKLERYDRRRIDGMWLNNCEVDKMLEKLLSWDMNERIANPCIGAQRADLVLAGCAILEAIRDIWPSKRLRVADRGLREGILTELMSRSGAWRKNRFMRHKNTYFKVNVNEKK